MADDSLLNIKIVVDGSSLSSGMSQAASTVESAAGKMAASLKSAGLSSADASSALKNLGFSAAESSSALQGAGFAIAGVGQEAVATTTALNGMDRAAAVASARIAGLDLGVGGLGNSLGRVAAQSPMLGSALAAAFPAIAAIALVDIISKIPGIFQEIIDSLAGWDSAQKKAYASLLTGNTQMLLEAAKLKVEINALNEIGVKGAEKYALAAKNNVFALQTWGSASRELLQEQERLSAELQALSNGGYQAYDFIAKALHSTRIAEIHTQLESVAKALKTIDQTQRELAGVAAPKIIKEGAAEEIEAAKRALENLAREREKEGKEQEDAAVRRGDAERREAEEKERLDEEVARSSEQLLKKDVETYERSLVQKTAITEQQGKNVLAQIRANAELAEKATAQTSVLGGASPAISEEARAAYQQEVAIVQQLIAAEDQLQQKLIATGAAQDDPKILDSQRRQVELTREMEKAWDDYAKKVQQVNAAVTNFVKQESSSVFSSVNSNIVAMVNGQQTIAQSLLKIWGGIIDGIIVDILKMAEKWVEQHLIMAAVSKIFHLQDADNAVISAAAAIAAAKTAGTAQIGLAGAGGVASMAAAPFPIDLSAPEFGAEMAALAAGFLAFDKGGIVPGYGPIPAIVHGGEMILNPAQQRALVGAGGSPVGGEQHVHFHINATDAHGVADFFSRNSDQIIGVLQRAQREFRI